MAINKHRKEPVNVKRKRGTFLAALAFAVSASFVAAAPATAIGLDTGTDSSASLDASTTTSTESSETEANGDANTATENEVTLSDNEIGVDGAAEVNADTETSTSVAESDNPENGNPENNTGAETEAEASGEGEADVSANTVAPVDGEGSELGFGTELLLRSNVLSLLSDPVTLEEGDVQAKTANESEANFDSDFTYYVVNHEVDYDKAVYRETARLGGNNVELSGSTTGSFWFGVSAPNEEGMQSQINHQGKILMYLETEDGWKSLEAQFNGEGELQHVNGVSPVMPDEETEE